MPFITHGVYAASYYYFINGIDIFFQFLFTTGTLIKNYNALALFYTGILVNTCILYIGFWLLGKRYFTSIYTHLFTSIALLGSSIWFSQIYFNQLSFYCLPLILYFGHRFLETGKWRFLLAAFNLWVIQSFSSMVFSMAVTSFVIAIYFFFDMVMNFGQYRRNIQNLKFNHFSFLYTVIGIILSAFLLTIIFISKDPNTLIFPQLRNPDGSVLLKTFLNYGGAIYPGKWIDLFTAQSNFRDANLYIGFFPVLFAAYAFFTQHSRRRLGLYLTIIVLGLFTAATHISLFTYYVWPLMKFYRHIGLVSPIISIFLCLLAGIGFEAFFFDKSLSAKRKKLIGFIFCIFFLLLGLSHVWLSQNPEGIKILRYLTSHSKLTPLYMGERGERFLISGFIALLIFFFWLIFSVWNRRISFLFFMASFFVLHTTDLYSYKIFEAKIRLNRFTENEFNALVFKEAPFVQFRKHKLGQFPQNERERIFENFFSSESLTARYCNVNDFLGADEVGCSNPVFFWPKTLNRYYNAYSGKNIEESQSIPVAYVKRKLTFPFHHPGALKFSGVTENKIQFFSKAYLVDDNDVASKISNSLYEGNVLFVSPKNGVEGNTVQKWSSSDNLKDNQRLNIAYSVDDFSANHLRLTVDTKNQDHAWLFYSDTWHPKWRAWINNNPVPVYKANLAYKAIPLNKGVNQIHFMFYSTWWVFLHNLLGLNALFWIGMIIYFLWKLPNSA
ncbi:MAG: hypothetical protein KBD53_08670 [Candidatus Omnitrophica bacterium]|nr:hypothetical protein [Candidatus Omnitrophota bacterium]